jgi:hypothetical protein
MGQDASPTVMANAWHWLSLLYEHSVTSHRDILGMFTASSPFFETGPFSLNHDMAECRELKDDGS